MGKYSVIIDPGHGGNDPGALSSHLDSGRKINEAALVLPYALELADALLARGFSVDLTRHTHAYKPTMQQRVQYTTRAMVFISIHFNAFSSARVSGFEAFYAETHDESEALAVSVCDAASAAKLTNMRNDGQPKLDSTSHRRSLYVLQRSQCPATLVELGFITNRDEVTKLTTSVVRAKWVKALAHGVHSFAKTSLMGR